MNIEQWLINAKERLTQAKIKSSRLDSEIILAHALKSNRTFLHTYPHKILKKQEIFHANNLLNQRAKRVPIAYLLGYKEFYGRDFAVNHHTLTPRPESESIIELYKKIAQGSDTVLDIGTGSGILAITCALETHLQYPTTRFFASDLSEKALQIAQENALHKKVDITFLYNDLLENIPFNILNNLTVIIANLPYVDLDWIDQSTPNELHHEPQTALYAEGQGLHLIKKLIKQTSQTDKLRYLILEADPQQHDAIIEYAEQFNFELQEAMDYCLLLKYKNR